MGLCFGFIPHSLDSRIFYIPPQLHNVWRSSSPVRHNLLQFRIGHFRSTHGFHCSDRSAITTCQFCDLTFLPKVSVDAMLDYWHTENLRSRGTVDVFAVCERLHPPRFAGKPCNDSCFNRREICHEELITGLWHECRPNQLRERVRNVFIQQFYGFQVAGLHEFPSRFQVGEMVLW